MLALFRNNRGNFIQVRRRLNDPAFAKKFPIDVQPVAFVFPAHSQAQEFVQRHRILARLGRSYAGQWLAICERGGDLREFKSCGLVHGVHLLVTVSVLGSVCGLSIAPRSGATWRRCAA